MKKAWRCLFKKIMIVAIFFMELGLNRIQANDGTATEHTWQTNDNGDISNYEIDGNVTFTGKPLTEPYAGTFVMKVHGRDWNIRLKRSWRDAPDYTEIGYDGTNLYSVTSMESIYKKFLNQGKKGGNIATAYLGKNEIYRSVFDPEFAMIWLTYGSRCYFDKKTQGDLLEPVITYDAQGIIEDRAKLPLYKTTWKRQDQFPFLPLEVIYFDPVNYLKSVTNSIFRVLSFATYENITFPKTATLETYQFLQPSNSAISEIELFSKYEVTMTAIRNIATTDFSPRPVLPGPTDFLDERIPTAGKIGYSNSNWIAVRPLK